MKTKAGTIAGRRLLCDSRSIAWFCAFAAGSVGYAGILFSAPAVAQEPGVQAVVRNAGHHGIHPEDIENGWKGDIHAYKAVYQILRTHPGRPEDWRNAVDALSIISAGNDKLARTTLADLKSFLLSASPFVTSLFGSPGPAAKSLSVCKGAGPECQLGYASMLAKTEVQHALGLLARLSPAVAPDVTEYLGLGTSPAFWQEAHWEWVPSPHYQNDIARDIDMATLSIRALGEICSDRSRGELAAAEMRIKEHEALGKPKQGFETAHTVLLGEINHLSPECRPATRSGH